jgi:hypothetical protein
MDLYPRMANGPVSGNTGIEPLQVAGRVGRRFGKYRRKRVSC